MHLLAFLTPLLQKTYFCEQFDVQKPLGKFKLAEEMETPICVNIFNYVYQCLIFTCNVENYEIRIFCCKQEIGHFKRAEF